MIISYAVAKFGQQPMNDSVRSQFNKEFISLKHGSIHYNWTGPEDGEIVVLVHGFSTPSVVFTKNVEALVIAGYRVLTYDHYGRGFSDRPDIEYSKRMYKDELIDLLDALNIHQPINVVGYSMGGGIATVFASRNPERVRRLILMSPIGFLPEASGIQKMLSLPIIGNWLMTVVGRQTLIDELYAYAEKGDAPLSMAQQFEEQFKYSGVENALVSTIKNFDMGNLSDDYRLLGKVEMPKMLIWGVRDDVCPFSGAEEIMAVVPDIELYSIEDGGHAIAYSHADKVNLALINFLQNN